MSAPKSPAPSGTAPSGAASAAVASAASPSPAAAAGGVAGHRRSVSSAGAGGGPVVRARAIYDYDAAPNSGQLSFRAGDVVVVISKGEAWWLARKDNVAPAAASATTPASPGPSSSAPIGLIPSNFFDVLPAVAGIDTATPAATGRGSKRLPEPERRRYCPERRSTASARSSAS